MGESSHTITTAFRHRPAWSVSGQIDLGSNSYSCSRGSVSHRRYRPHRCSRPQRYHPSGAGRVEYPAASDAITPRILSDLLRVAIVGYGIGGIAAALQLRRLGDIGWLSSADTARDDVLRVTTLRLWDAQLGYLFGDSNYRFGPCDLIVVADGALEIAQSARGVGGAGGLAGCSGSTAADRALSEASAFVNRVTGEVN